MTGLASPGVARTSMPPIANAAEPSPSTRIEAGSSKAGRPRNTTLEGPGARSTAASRVTRAASGKTVTRSIRDATSTSAAKAGQERANARAAEARRMGLSRRLFLHTQVAGRIEVLLGRVGGVKSGP